ncbi:MAG: hypothetical protein K9H16_11000, partial [Bacteroidales bacterium]|nr:hypothetical protein [Bacteroidales bacterium]
MKLHSTEKSITNSFIKRLLGVISVFLLTNIGVYGQLDSWLNNMQPEQNYYDIKYGMQEYLNSLEKTMDSAVFYAGDGEYKRFKIFESIWEPRVSPHGEFSKYYDAQEDYYKNLQDDYTFYTTASWHELGPKTIQTSGSKGIGPVEFVTFYDNGTTDSTFIMLTGSTLGGLFYSTDTANTWQSAGTDTWSQSGVSWAVFNPNNYRMWYVASSGNGASTEASWIGKLGGVFRTNDEGQSWDTIADYHDLGGSYFTKIFKLLINPNNPDILFVATFCGLYKTNNCNSSDPGWTKVLDGFIYDLELKPTNDSVMYASIYDSSLDRWLIMRSENYGGALTWDTLSAQPEYLSDSIVRHQHITIEVSKARPDYLYCFTRDSSSHTLYYTEMDIHFNWHKIVSFQDKYGYGSGHGFGVEQTGNGDTIMVSHKFDCMKYNILTGTGVSCVNVHDDTEDIVFHPYNSGEVWACTHGGVEKIINYGNEFKNRYNGLGVGQIEGFTTSYTNPRYILTGIYHDGSQITTDPYQQNWNPQWKHVFGGDGMKPVIDNLNTNRMYASAQYGSWSYTPDLFNSYESIYGNNSHFLTIGVLNKENPIVFFKSQYDPEPFENIFRNSWDASIGEGKISEFQNVFTYAELIITIGLYTPFNDGDYLLANLKTIDSNATSHQTMESFHLMRSVNANSMDTLEVLWEELTIPTNKRNIAGVVFDPGNPDKIILAYTTQTINSISDSLIFKIDYSNPNDPIFEPITYNLPITCVNKNCITVDKFSDGGIFLATEYGVFYTDNNLQQDTLNAWQLVGTGLPHVRSTGLEMSYPSNSLRVALFGRGIWEMPFPCPYDSVPLSINSDTTWNSPITMDRNLIINSGKTLTINSQGIIHLPTDAKIIVKPGGKLVLNGGTLSNGCNGLWQGIEVWGNPEATQIPANQGWLSISNGGTIENAEVAVRVGSEDYTN